MSQLSTKGEHYWQSAQQKQNFKRIVALLIFWAKSLSLCSLMFTRAAQTHQAGHKFETPELWEFQRREPIIDIFLPSSRH